MNPVTVTLPPSPLNRNVVKIQSFDYPYHPTGMELVKRRVVGLVQTFPKVPLVGKRQQCTL